MDKLSKALIAAGFLISTAGNLFGGELKIIANPSVKAEAISADELKSVFLLQKKTLKDGSLVQPVLQKSGAPHDRFLRQYLERDDQDLHSYYQGLVFTGRASMPKELNSDAEVVAYVARTKGAIAYVSNEAGTEGVKVLALSGSAKNERKLIKRVEPEYPAALKPLYISGAVRLELTVAPKGTVETVEILGGNPILAEEAVKAAKQWIYAPAAASEKIEVSIEFLPRP